MNRYFLVKIVIALVLGVVIGIFIKFFELVQIEPQRILAIANIVLVLITAYYAYCNQKLVRLIEKQNKRKIMAELYKLIYVYLDESIKRIRERLQQGNYGFDLIEKEGTIACGSPDLIMISIKALEDPILTITGDNIVDQRLKRLNELVNNYDSCISKLWEILENAASKLISNKEFMEYLNNICKSYKKNFKLNPLTIIRIILNNMEPSPTYYSEYLELWKEQGPKIRDFIDPIIADDLKNVENMRKKCLSKLEQVYREAVELFEYIRLVYSIELS